MVEGRGKRGRGREEPAGEDEKEMARRRQGGIEEVRKGVGEAEETCEEGGSGAGEGVTSQLTPATL